MQGYLYQVPRLPHTSLAINLVSALFNIAEAFIIKHQLRQTATHEYYQITTHSSSHQPPQPPAHILPENNRKNRWFEGCMADKAGESDQTAQSSADTAKTQPQQPFQPPSQQQTQPQAKGLSYQQAFPTPTIQRSIALPPPPDTIPPPPDVDLFEEETDLAHQRPYRNTFIPILTTTDISDYHIALLLYQPLAFTDEIMYKPGRRVKSIKRVGSEAVGGGKCGGKVLGHIPRQMVHSTTSLIGRHGDVVPNTINPNQVESKCPITTSPATTLSQSSIHIHYTQSNPIAQACLEDAMMVSGSGKKVGGSGNGNGNGDNNQEQQQQQQSQQEQPYQSGSDDILISTNYHFLYNLLNTNEIDRLQYRTQFHNLSWDQFLIALATLQAHSTSQLKYSMDMAIEKEFVVVNQCAEEIVNGKGGSRNYNLGNDGDNYGQQEEQDYLWNDAIAQSEIAFTKSILTPSSRSTSSFSSPTLPIRSIHFPTIQDCVNIIDNYITTTTIFPQLFPQLSAFPQYALPQKGLLWLMDLIYEPSVDDVLGLVNGVTWDVECGDGSGDQQNGSGGNNPHHTHFHPLLFTLSIPGLPFGYDYPVIGHEIELDDIVSVKYVPSGGDNNHCGDNDNNPNHQSASLSAPTTTTITLSDPILSITEPVDLIGMSSLCLHPIHIRAREKEQQQQEQQEQDGTDDNNNPSSLSPSPPPTTTYGQSFFMQAILRRYSPTLLHALVNVIGVDTLLVWRNYHTVANPHQYVEYDKLKEREKNNKGGSDNGNKNNNNKQPPNRMSVFDLIEIARTFTYAPDLVERLESGAKEMYGV